MEVPLPEGRRTAVGITGRCKKVFEDPRLRDNKTFHREEKA
jgi:hypothetical protein